MAKKNVRMLVTLACTECKERTYLTEKNRRNDPGRMELVKNIAPVVGSYQLHRETR